MKEYIEREAAKNAFPRAEADAFENCRYCTCLDSEQIDEILDNIPPADVVAVRHGRWTGHDIGNGRLSIDDDTCSLCGSRFYQIAETGCVWHYCPNCGARMDGDGNG